MFVLTFTRKLYKVLSSDSSPSAIAFAVAFGILAGSVPLSSGLTFCMLLAVLVFRVQISSALLAWGLMRLLSRLVLAPLYAALGRVLLDAEALHGFWTLVINLPVVAWFGFHQYAVLGGAVVGLILGAALFYPVRLGILAYRRWLHERVSSNKFFRWLTNFWVVRLLKFVFVGVRS